MAEMPEKRCKTLRYQSCSIPLLFASDWYFVHIVLKALDMLNTVPHVDIENYDDIENKLDDLVTKIKGILRHVLHF